MKKVLNFLKVQKYLILILISITVFVVSSAVNNHAKNKENILDEIKAIEAKLPIKDNIAVEIGSILPEIKDYFNDNREISTEATIKYYLDEKEVKEEDICTYQNKKCILNKTNTYKVIIIDDEEYHSSLIILDNTPPEVITKDVTIYSGDSYNVNDFIKTYTDNSGSKEYDASYVDNNQSEITNVGTVAIKIKVCDKSKNCTEVSARLIIEKKNPETNSGKQNKKPTNNTSSKPNSGDSNTGSGNKPSSGNNTGTNTPKPKTCTAGDKVEKVIISSKSIYGTQENTYTNVTYHYDTNCNKTEKSRTAEQFEVVYKTFNGTVSQMKSEAVGLYNNQAVIRSSILQYTNEYRAEAGAPALQIDYNLSILATLRAMEMAYSNTFSHTRPSGKAWYTIWDDYGLAKGRVVGENLGKGYTTPAGVSKGWKNSQAHYENLVNTDFKKIGIGKFTYQHITYWAQEFSS